MKYAIYFLAVGDAAVDCLELSYKSLRQAGFKNDVFVLCDRDPVPFEIAENTKILKIKDEHLNLEETSSKPLALYDVRALNRDNERNVRNPKKWTICRAKTLIDKYVNFDDYDYVVYLDVDVLTNGPTEVFSDFLKQNTGTVITAQNQDGDRLGGRGNFSFRELRRVLTPMAANLTMYELLKHWFTKAICSDIVCIPANETGKRLLREWRAECLKNIDYDQPALQAVLLRFFSDKHKHAPYDLFGYGPRHKKYLETKELRKVDSVFVHFGGAIKDPSAFNAYFKKYL